METATVTVKGVSFQLTADELEALALDVGDRRAAMSTAVPANYEPEGVVKAIKDPNWSCELDGISGVTLLSLRDPRFGWLSYALPARSAISLARQLARLQAMSQGARLQS